MSFVLSVLIMLLATVIAVQDFRYRRISSLHLPAMLLLFVASRWINTQTFPWHDLFINWGMLAIQFGGVMLYFSIRKGKLINIADSYIGWGDILMLVVLCTAFSPLNYFVFYMTGLVVSLLWYTVSVVLLQNGNKQIPLAGIYAVLMISIIPMQLFSHSRWNFYNDDFLFSFVIRNS